MLACATKWFGCAAKCWAVRLSVDCANEVFVGRTKCLFERVGHLVK